MKATHCSHSRTRWNRKEETIPTTSLRALLCSPPLICCVYVYIVFVTLGYPKDFPASFVYLRVSTAARASLSHLACSGFRVYLGARLQEARQQPEGIFLDPSLVMARSVPLASLRGHAMTIRFFQRTKTSRLIW